MCVCVSALSSLSLSVCVCSLFFFSLFFSTHTVMDLAFLIHLHNFPPPTVCLHTPTCSAMEADRGPQALISEMPAPQCSNLDTFWRIAATPGCTPGESNACKGATSDPHPRRNRTYRWNSRWARITRQASIVSLGERQRQREKERESVCVCGGNTKTKRETTSSTGKIRQEKNKEGGFPPSHGGLGLGLGKTLQIRCSHPNPNILQYLQPILCHHGPCGHIQAYEETQRSLLAARDPQRPLLPTHLIRQAV